MLSIISSPGFAVSIPDPVPSDACHFLSGMPFIKTPSTYKPYAEGSEDYTCGTPYFEIETPNSSDTMNNNIAYYVSGNQDKTKGNDSNLLIVFYVQIMPDDFVMQLHRF